MFSFGVEHFSEGACLQEGKQEVTKVASLI